MSILIIFIVYILAFLASFFVKNRRFISFASILASLAGFFASLDIALKVASDKIYQGPFGSFSVDSLGAILIILTTFLGFCAALYSKRYIEVEMEKGVIGLRRGRQYFGLLNLFLLMVSGAIFANNPILMWIFIEATTLSTAFLISFYHKLSAMEAAWKYLVINSIGLLLGFFGTLLYFIPLKGWIGDGVAVSWGDLAMYANMTDPMIAKIAFVFILIGYGTKVGFVPMHTWKPDTYSKVPTPVAVLFSGVLLNVAFSAILKFKNITDISVGGHFSQNLLLIFGFLSIAVSALIMFIQKNYKRLLAYSSVEHAGVVALGFGFGGVGAYAAVLHMIYHSLAKSALFLATGNIFLKYSSTKISNVRNMFLEMPKTSKIFILGVGAAVGLPPFGIFFTKFSILLSGAKDYLWLVILTAFLLALVFVGFLKHLSKMLFESESEADVQKSAEIEPKGLLIYIPVLIIAVLLVLSWYVPEFIKTLISNALLSI